MNRLEWDLSYLAPDLIRGSVMSLSRVSAGPRAAPGIYTVELDVDGEKRTQNLKVRKDPRWEASDEDLRKQFALARSVLEELNRSHAAIRRNPFRSRAGRGPSNPDYAKTVVRC